MLASPGRDESKTMERACAKNWEEFYDKKFQPGVHTRQIGGQPGQRPFSNSREVP